MARWAAWGSGTVVSVVQVASCTFEAAKFAVMNWHYSQAMPSGKLIKHGVWEDGAFIGVVLYGRGANRDLLKPYGLDITEGCELVRIALDKHEATVSSIVSASMKILKQTNPRLRIVVSFADNEQGHHGGIYQAGNWIYLGQSIAADEYIIHGERVHGRSARAIRQQKQGGARQGESTLTWLQKHVDPKAERIVGSRKHRYVYPLDKAMRRNMIKQAKQYPRAVEGLTVSRNTSGIEGQVRSLATAQNKTTHKTTQHTRKKKQ